MYCNLIFVSISVFFSSIYLAVLISSVLLQQQLNVPVDELCISQETSSHHL